MKKIFEGISYYVKNTDLYLLVISVLCSIYGVVLVYSATAAYETNKYVLVQCLAIFIGIVGFIVASLVDIDYLSGLSKWLFVLNLCLIGSLFFFGVSGGGNKGWIRFSGIGIQPAEIGKVIFIFTFSYHVSILKDRINSVKYLFHLFVHFAIVAGFIIVFSSDAGTALSYAFICVIILFVAGISMKWIVGGCVLLIASIPFIWNFVLKDFQKTRILVSFDPSLDPDKAFQATQSRIAIGAGKLFGTGYLQGRQVQYGNIPAKQTDFIFSVAGEEFGFVGCAIIIILLSLLILRLFYVSYKADSIFSSYVAAGIGGMIMFQTVQNILMCLGMFPVVGLTLPFFSYGGSSIVTMFTSVGMAAGIRMREKPSWLR